MRWKTIQNGGEIMPTRDEIEARNRKAGAALLDQGEQLGLFGEGGAPIGQDKRGPGRPVGAQNKLKSKLREYMAARGYRDPAEQLAMIAGLDQPLHPMAYAAQVAESIGEPVLAVAQQVRQAAEALLPYWHPKITPDAPQVGSQVNILMQGMDGRAALVVDGVADPFAPLDVRAAKVLQNQQVADDEPEGSDAAPRTEGAKL
jgi:hypothetical protein